MKYIVVIVCCVAVALAAPNAVTETSEKKPQPALLHEEKRDDLGQYFLHYVTVEGTEITENGRLIPTPDGQAYVLVVEGETKFLGDDGKVYITKYTAGLDGTHVEGAHLPVPVVAEPQLVAPDSTPKVPKQ